MEVSSFVWPVGAVAGCRVVVCHVLQPIGSKWLQVASLLSERKWTWRLVLLFNVTVDVSGAFAMGGYRCEKGAEKSCDSANDVCISRSCWICFGSVVKDTKHKL
jgi:hypothetical protein